tara:strand:+ start:230 stop:529 length:300 start_codon:yes stop_codon:yes gene_type:complete
MELFSLHQGLEMTKNQQIAKLMIFTLHSTAKNFSAFSEDEYRLRFAAARRAEAAVYPRSINDCVDWGCAYSLCACAVFELTLCDHEGCVCYNSGLHYFL